MYFLLGLTFFLFSSTIVQATNCGNGVPCQCGDTIPAGVTTSLAGNLYCTTPVGLKVQGHLRCNNYTVNMQGVGLNAFVLSGSQSATLGCWATGATESGFKASSQLSPQMVLGGAYNNPIGYDIKGCGGALLSRVQAFSNRVGIRLRNGGRNHVHYANVYNNTDYGVDFSNEISSKLENSDANNNRPFDVRFTNGAASNIVWDDINDGIPHYIGSIYFASGANNNRIRCVNYGWSGNDGTTSNNTFTCP